MEPTQEPLTPEQIRTTFGECFADLLGIDNNPEVMRKADELLARIYMKGLIVQEDRY